MELSIDKLPLFETIKEEEALTHNVIETHSNKSLYTTKFEQLLATILPSNQEQDKLNKARQLLGKEGEGFTDEQLETVIAQFELLVAQWLDEYEKSLFGHKTLKELLKVT